MSILSGLRPMRGRDRAESHRAATPLELLYDLTFVVAFSIASSQVAKAVAEGHIGTGLLSFVLALFSIMWCWINYSWFASAFDTDDWGVRAATLVQMVGVLILGVGLPTMFASFQHGIVDNRVMVAGYVVMRVAMIALWWRVWKANPHYRPIAKAYILTLIVAQAGWTALAVFDLPTQWTIAAFVLMFLVEVGGVAWAETRWGPSPWHPHHIAERHSLLIIITLGEVILGTTTSISSLVEEAGWTLDAVVLCAAGVSLAVGMWWTYFGIPHGTLLQARPRLAFPWGYGHLLLYAAVIATGAGLHGAALELAGNSTLSPLAVTTCIAVPVGVFLIGTLIVHALAGRWTLTHTLLALAIVAVLALSVVLSAVGVRLTWCFAVIMVAPWLAVGTYESAAGQKLRHGCALRQD